jgi:hypothetical protein
VSSAFILIVPSGRFSPSAFRLLIVTFSPPTSVRIVLTLLASKGVALSLEGLA